jgi:GNAT superfamily N-acetyltransferase
VEIRNFRQNDVAGVVSLWNSVLEEYQQTDPWYVEETRISSDTLDRIVSHPNHDTDGVFLACEGSEIVGYARAAVKRVKAYEEEEIASQPGFLESLLVKPSCRRRGLGSQLFERAETFVKGEGKEAYHAVRMRSAIAGNSVVVDSAAHTFLLNRDFETQSREMRLELDVEAFELREEIVQLRDALLGQGIELRFYEARDYGSMEQLMERHFRNWWFGGYRSNAKKEEPSPVLVAVDRERNQVVGFVGFVTVSSNGRAGFSPGVDPDYRGRGIGKALCNLWGDEAKKIGATGSRISVGVRDSPAKTIYLDMGYRKIGEFCSRLVKDFGC